MMMEWENNKKNYDNLMACVAESLYIRHLVSIYSIIIDLNLLPKVITEII